MSPYKACLIALYPGFLSLSFTLYAAFGKIYVLVYKIQYKTNKNWPESSSWLRLTFAFMLLADASTPKQHIAHILCLLKPWFAIFSHAIQWKSTGNRPSFVCIPTCSMLSLLLMLIVRLKMQQSFMLYIEIKWTVNKHPMIVVSRIIPHSSGSWSIRSNIRETQVSICQTFM